MPTAVKTDSRQKAATVSSFMTYSSLLMAAMDRPAAADRVAVLETRELPGIALRMD